MRSGWASHIEPRRRHRTFLAYFSTSAPLPFSMNLTVAYLPLGTVMIKGTANWAVAGGCDLHIVPHFEVVALRRHGFDLVMAQRAAFDRRHDHL